MEANTIPQFHRIAPQTLLSDTPDTPQAWNQKNREVFLSKSLNQQFKRGWEAK